MNDSMMTETKPVKVDGVALPPGEMEANAIRKDYEIFAKGAEAFLRMGLRLIDVKARLRHGEYMPWCEENLGELSKPWIHRAKQTAEWAIKRVGTKCLPPVDIWNSEKLPLELAEMVDGRSANQLIAEIHEFRQDEAEKKAKAACESAFLDDPELRDEWEPRVLSGELTWCEARVGIAGQTTTKGKKRSAPDYSHLLRSSIVTLGNGFSKWTELPEEARSETVISLRKVISALPDEVKQAIGLSPKN